MASMFDIMNPRYAFGGQASATDEDPGPQPDDEEQQQRWARERAEAKARKASWAAANPNYAQENGWAAPKSAFPEPGFELEKPDAPPQAEADPWNSLKERAAGVPWRGPKPPSVLSSELLQHLRERAQGGDPDALDAAKAYVDRLEGFKGPTAPESTYRGALGEHEAGGHAQQEASLPMFDALKPQALLQMGRSSVPSRNPAAAEAAPLPPVPHPEPDQEPDADADDLRIGPSPGAAAGSKFDGLNPSPVGPAAAPPFAPGEFARNAMPTPDASPMLKAAGVPVPRKMDLGEAVAWASYKANHPEATKEEFLANREGNRGAGALDAQGRLQAGAPTSREEVQGTPGRVGTGLGDTMQDVLKDLQQRSVRGDPDAVRKMEFLDQHPSYMQNVFGKPQFQIEQEERDAAKARMERQDQMSMGRFAREGAKQEADIKHQEAMTKIAEQGQALQERLANASTETERQKIQNQMDEFKIGAQAAKEKADQDRAQAYKIASEQRAAQFGSPEEAAANRARQGRLAEAQTKLAEAQTGRQERGEEDPAVVRDNIKKAAILTQKYINEQDMEPEEAVKQAATAMGVDPKKLVVPPENTSLRALAKAAGGDPAGLLEEAWNAAQSKSLGVANKIPLAASMAKWIARGVSDPGEKNKADMVNYLTGTKGLTQAKAQALVDNMGKFIKG